MRVMCKCLGEGGTNAARCWVACMSHRADGWLRLLRPGCPGSNVWLPAWALLMQLVTLTCLGSPGLVTKFERFLEMIHTHTCLLTYTQAQKVWVGLPWQIIHIPGSPVLSLGKTRWPGSRWVDKWEVMEVSGGGTQNPHFLYIRHRGVEGPGGQEIYIYLKSLFGLSPQPVLIGVQGIEIHHRIC